MLRHPLLGQKTEVCVRVGGAFLIWPSGDFFDGFVSPPSTFLLSEIKLLRIVCCLQVAAVLKSLSLSFFGFDLLCCPHSTINNLE